MMAVPHANLEAEYPAFAAGVPPARPGPALRRRASLQQGFALEALGHAVEYLVDSRMFAATGYDARTDQEAIQLLMRLSRTVFQECPEVQPASHKVRRWLQLRLDEGKRALGRSAPGRP